MSQQALLSAMRVLSSATRGTMGARAALARRDPSFFCQFVLRDEQTGKPIIQAPVHEKWHRILNDNNRVVVWSHVDAGKTQQISIGRSLYELGRNPNIRIAIISKTSDLAKKIVRSCGQYVEKSAELKMSFPSLLPARDPSLPWTSHALTVERRVFSKDPSIQACGVYGNIHGARIDLLVLDDVLDYENTRTAVPREHLWGWVRGTLFGRLSEHARVAIIGNAFHPTDMMHRMEKEPRFVGFRFPVVTNTGELSWPKHWPQTRIDAAREDMGPVEFSRALLCQARDDETARIKREWIEKCCALGEGQHLVTNQTDLGRELGIPEVELLAASTERTLALKPSLIDPLAARGIRLFTGVDLAVQKHDAADLTVLFTIARLPNGTRRVCEIKSGHWGAPQILAEIKDAYVRWGSTFCVENNASQQYIVDLIQDSTAIPCVPFTTGRQKAHPEFGVEGLGHELAGGKWIIPTGREGKERGREIDAWISELYGYDPTVHTGDRLMASWFARELARAIDREDQSSGGAHVTIIAPEGRPEVLTRGDTAAKVAAISTVNPDELAEAKRLEEEFRAAGFGS